MRRRPRIRWRRRPRPQTPSNHQSLALIHLGRALSAHQDGDPLRAIRQLSMAAESIMALIEEWSGSPVVEAEEP